MASDTTIAVALPWHDGPRAAYLGGEHVPVHPAAILNPCADCGQVLAVGPALALALSVTPGMDLCCPACGVGRCHGSKAVVRIALTRDAIAH